MRNLIYAAAALACMAGVANSADMPPVKAPKLAALTATGGGCYWLLESHMDGTKVGVTAPSGTPASIFAAGGNVGIGGGCTKVLGPKSRIAFEGWVDVANTGASAGAASMSNRVSGTQRLLYFGDTSMFTQFLPNLNLTQFFPASNGLPINVPTCPPGQSCNPLSDPYVGLVVREDRNEFIAGVLADRAIRVTYGLTMGFETLMTDGSKVDTWASATSSSGAHPLGPNLSARPGMTFSAGVNWKHALTSGGGWLGM